MSAKTYIKDPDAVLDYGFDWSEWLGTDTIATSTWAADTGITIDSETETTTTTTVWLSGGTIDAEYEILNEIVTAGGRTENRTLTIKIADR